MRVTPVERDHSGSASNSARAASLAARSASETVGHDKSEGADGVDEDRRGHRLHHVLVIGGDDVPRRPLGRCRRDGVFVRLHVLIPVGPHCHIGGVELPLLVGVVEASHEASLLLGLGHVQEELDDLGAVAVEVPFEGVEVVVASCPELGAPIAPRQLLLVDPLRVDAQGKDLLVLGPIEDPDPAALGSRLGDPPQEGVIEFLAGGFLNDTTCTPWGLTPDMTCSMVESLPAASIAWNTTNRA